MNPSDRADVPGQARAGRRPFRDSCRSRIPASPASPRVRGPAGALGGPVPTLRRGGRSLLLLALVAIPGCEGPTVQSRELLATALAVGMPAPPYEGTTLGGDTLRLEALRGQVVLFNAWATWCHPCIEELPVLQMLHERFEPQGLRMVGVSIDRDEPRELQRFLDSHGVTYINLQDRQWDLSRTFGWGAGVPRSLLIDREGKVALFWIGGVSPENSVAIAFLADTIAALLR